MGDAMAASRTRRFRALRRPRSTSGVVGAAFRELHSGGRVWMEVDMRSGIACGTDKLEKKFLADVAAAVEVENKTRSTRNGSDHRRNATGGGSQRRPDAPRTPHWCARLWR